jgi:hypothetical protein
MIQARSDSTDNVVPLLCKPLTMAERSRNYRARQHLKKLAGKSRGAKKRVTKAVTDDASRDAKIPVTAAVTTVTPIPSRDAVDLVQLRRDIWRWVKAHQEVERTKRRDQRRQVYDAVQRYVFFWAGATFFCFLAYAASVHP